MPMPLGELETFAALYLEICGKCQCVLKYALQAEYSSSFLVQGWRKILKANQFVKLFFQHLDTALRT